MTVAELKKKCEGMIADGFADSEIILCKDNDTYFPLNAGFSSLVYNREDVYEVVSDFGLESDNCVVLN